MTRDEQTIIASEKYSNSLEFDFNLDYETLEWAFQAGAQWADANPCWHKCDEELPEDTDPVLLYGIDKGEDEPWMAVGERDFFNDRWKVYGQPDWMERNVIAWMELPQPPKID